MEAAIMSIYHEKRKINPSEAREFIKNILKQNNYNVSLTAKILGISRHTVRRARDGDLNDYSRAPKKPKTKYNNKFRNLYQKMFISIYQKRIYLYMPITL